MPKQMLSSILSPASTIKREDRAYCTRERGLRQKAEAASIQLIQV
jgi:hypothetical protein